jgi:hypothetical protein
LLLTDSLSETAYPTDRLSDSLSDSWRSSEWEV